MLCGVQVAEDGINEPSEAEALFEPEKLSSLMQRTNLSESSEASVTGQNQSHQPTRQPRLTCDISVLRDVTGCTDESSEFLEHVVRQHHGSIEVGTPCQHGQHISIPLVQFAVFRTAIGVTKEHPTDMYSRKHGRVATEQDSPTK